MEGYIAEVRLFAANFQPRNWAYCDGRLLSISTNSALFSLLGTTYGGNGQTTFGLPDCRGRSVLSAGQSPGTSQYFEGEITGYNTATMLQSNLPSHTHVGLNNPPAMLASSSGGESSSPSDAVPATLTTNYYSATADSKSLPVSTQLQASVSGSSAPFSIMKPYLGMNYIICMFGIYPSRS